MRTRNEIINEAIDLLSKKTGEDFHGYRSEIWVICGNIYDEASRDSRQLSAVPEEFYKKSLERISKAVGITDPIVLISMAKNNDQTYVDILVDYIEEIYKKHCR